VNGRKLYLSACMDLYNGEIIVHRMSRRPLFQLASSTLKAALSRIRSAAELIVHSDQGWRGAGASFASLRRYWLEAVKGTKRRISGERR